MPYSIKTKDDIIINNIPDDVARDSQVLKDRVAKLRADRDGTSVPDPKPELVETPVIETPVEETSPTIAEAAQSAVDVLKTPIDLGRNILSSAIAEPISGVAGVVQSLNPLAEEGAGAEAVKATQEALTTDLSEGTIDTLKGVGSVFQTAFDALPPLGQDILRVMGDEIGDDAQAAIQFVKGVESETLERFGPLGATALVTAPTALLEAIPGAIALKKARNLQVTIADEIVEEVNDKVKGEAVETVKAGPAPEAKDYSEITRDLRQQKADKVAEQVLPDQEILDAAEALNVDLNPSHYSTNRAFKDVENSLKSRPGSKLNIVEEKAIVDTGRAADGLIQDLKGTTDKSLLDTSIADEINLNIKNLDDQAGVAYKAVDDAIPKATQVNPDASRLYINRQLEELGGDESLLTAAEKKLLRIADEETHLTYSAIDRIRKDIGSAIGKKSGPFKDDDVGTLKQLYKVLSEDQQGVADAFGVGADYAAARKLVATRKGLEEEAVTLFGREMQGSLVPKLNQAATALTKGDASKFNKLIEAIPENRRQEVVATMLNDIFTSGARKKDSISSGFMSAFESLNRNTAAKDLLFSHLPAESRKRFDDIGKVATGIFSSKALENNSRTARDIIAAMEDGGMFGRLYDKGENIVNTVGGTQGRLITQAVAKVKTPASDAADALLTSPGFKQSVEAAARGSLDESQKITKTSAFKKWITAQPPEIQAEVAAIGFIPFLTKPEETEEE